MISDCKTNCAFEFFVKITWNRLLNHVNLSEDGWDINDQSSVMKFEYFSLILTPCTWFKSLFYVFFIKKIQIYNLLYGLKSNLLLLHNMRVITCGKSNVHDRNKEGDGSIDKSQLYSGTIENIRTFYFVVVSFKF